MINVWDDAQVQEKIVHDWIQYWTCTPEGKQVSFFNPVWEAFLPWFAHGGNGGAGHSKSSISSGNSAYRSWMAQRSWMKWPHKSNW